VAIWGLAFKPETDDIRESPAMVLIDQLLNAGVSVRVADPEALKNVQAIYGSRLTYCAYRHEALEGADALAIVTDWEEYRSPDFVLMKALMRHPVIFDGRNLLDQERATSSGFRYQGIGRRIAGPRLAWVDARTAPSTPPTRALLAFDPDRVTSGRFRPAAAPAGRPVRASA
jgi:UDPglucose 6-dehydrogenase